MLVKKVYVADPHHPFASQTTEASNKAQQSTRTPFLSFVSVYCLLLPNSFLIASNQPLCFMFIMLHAYLSQTALLHAHLFPQNLTALA